MFYKALFILVSLLLILKEVDMASMYEQAYNKYLSITQNELNNIKSNILNNKLKITIVKSFFMTTYPSTNLAGLLLKFSKSRKFYTFAISVK